MEHVSLYLNPHNMHCEVYVEHLVRFSHCGGVFDYSPSGNQRFHQRGVWENQNMSLNCSEESE